jgi:acetylornithine deacetylase
LIDDARRNQIQNAVKRSADDLFETLRTLVRIPSVVGDEGAAQEKISALFAEAGLSVKRLYPDLQAIKSHPAFIDTQMSYENRYNVIGRLDGEDDAKSLVVNGHIDVVSPEPTDAWTKDPWGAEIENGRMYGRGSGDMKAGIVANLFALKALESVGMRPRGPVEVHSVIDEEAGGAGGTLACLAAGHTADGWIATEPHHLKVVISHAGINYFRVRITGKTAHAGLAHLGVNAALKMIPIATALAELDQKRGREVRFPLYEKGSGRSCHLNIGTFHAGDWPSTVAGKAEIACRIGFIPGETEARIKKLVERTVAEAAAKDEWLSAHPPVVEWFGWRAEPWYQDPAHPLVTTLKKNLEYAVGEPVEIAGRASGNDGRFAPYFNMPSVVTGPVAGNIHGLDEYVELNTVLQTTATIALTIAEWCGVRE